MARRTHRESGDRVEAQDTGTNENVKGWTGRPFRPEQYKSHMVRQHAVKWTEYCAATTEARMAHFDVQTPFVNRIDSYFGPFQPIKFVLSLPVVDCSSKTAPQSRGGW